MDFQQFISLIFNPTLLGGILLLFIIVLIIDQFTTVFVGLQLLKLLILSILYLLDILFSLTSFLYSMIFYAPYLYLSSAAQNKKNKKNKKNEKSIIIIGYSFAGFEVHKNLQNNASLSHYKFTIIEPKTYFEFTPSVLQAMTKLSKYKSISFPVKNIFDSTRSVLIHGRAISINSNENYVTVMEINKIKSYCCGGKKNTQKQKKINFDYCFICTGSKYASPSKVNTHPNIGDNIYYESRAAEFKEIYSVLADEKQTKSVAIIGGGPVGVELMAEIIDAFPQKNVTIIDANSSLCRSFPEKTQVYLQKWIEKRRNNITLRLNTRINEIITPFDDVECKWCENNVCKNSSKTTVIISGKMDIEQYKSNDKNMCQYQLKSEHQSAFDGLEYDMVFRCAGFQPNSELLTGHHEGLTGKYKFICVDEWLRVNIMNNKNIFASGDVIQQARVKEIKLAHTAEIHAQYIRHLMVYLNKNNKNNINQFIPYHEWLLGKGNDSNDKDKEKKYKIPSIFTISLGSIHGSMGFVNFVLNGLISVIFKWFIEVSSCKAYQRKPIFEIKIKGKVIFKLYPIGNRIFTEVWKFNHFFTVSYIRFFNKFK